MRYAKYCGMLIAFLVMGAAGYRTADNISNTPGMSCSSGLGRSVTADHQGRLHVIWTEFPFDTLGAQVRIRLQQSRDPLPSKLGLQKDIDRLVQGRYRGFYQAETSLIMYRRSLDGGATWQPAVQIAVDTIAGNATSVATDGTNGVHIAWSCTAMDTLTNISNSIHYIRSLDGGATWQPARLMEDADTTATRPILAVDGTVHLVWSEGSDTLVRFVHTRSTDDGSAWQPAQTLVEVSSGVYVLTHTLCASGGRVHLAWNAMSNDSVMDIWYKSSEDQGVSWSSPKCLTDGSYLTNSPSIAADAGYVALVDTHLSAFISVDTVLAVVVDFLWSEDGGRTWTPRLKLTDTTGTLNFYPEVAVHGRSIAVTYAKYESMEDTTFDICFRSSRDGGASWTPETTLLVNCYNGIGPSVTFDDAADAHIVTSDDHEAPNQNVEVYHISVAVGEEPPPPGIGGPPRPPLAGLSLHTGSTFFDTKARLTYALPGPGRVRLAVYDFVGRHVRTLVCGSQAGGMHDLVWDGTDNAGHPVPDGIYVVRLEHAGARAQVRLVRVGRR